MSSTERAPEPTMEEILASIRRIITDDESGEGRAQKAAHETQADDESLEGEADSRIIDDIARVLSGGSAEEPANEEEEILDLTSELGGLEVVEEEVVEEVVEITDLGDAAEVLDLEEMEVAEPVAEEMAAPVPPVASPVFEPSTEMTPPPQPQMAAPQFQPAAQPQTQAPAPEPVQPAAPQPSASQEAASALERAIAALRAGQVPTSTTPQAEPFTFQTAPQPEAPAPEPEPIPMAVPMPEPEPEGETHQEPASYFAPQEEQNFEAEPEEAPVLASEAEPDLALGDVDETGASQETFPPEAAEPEPFWPREAPSWQAQTPEPELEPSFEAGPEPEAEPLAAQVNGAHPEAAGKTLEDSIKDMLRPMLRQWLDENMPRMIRDELDQDTLRRHQD